MKLNHKKILTYTCLICSNLISSDLSRSGTSEIPGQTDPLEVPTFGGAAAAELDTEDMDVSAEVQFDRQSYTISQLLEDVSIPNKRTGNSCRTWEPTHPVRLDTIHYMKEALDQNQAFWVHFTAIPEENRITYIGVTKMNLAFDSLNLCQTKVSRSEFTCQYLMELVQDFCSDQPCEYPFSIRVINLQFYGDDENLIINLFPQPNHVWDVLARPRFTISLSQEKLKESLFTFCSFMSGLFKAVTEKQVKGNDGFYQLNVNADKLKYIQAGGDLMESNLPVEIRMIRNNPKFKGLIPFGSRVPLSPDLFNHKHKLTLHINIRNHADPVLWGTKNIEQAPPTATHLSYENLSFLVAQVFEVNAFPGLVHMDVMGVDPVLRADFIDGQVQYCIPNKEDTTEYRSIKLTNPENLENHLKMLDGVYHLRNQPVTLDNSHLLIKIAAGNIKGRAKVTDTDYVKKLGEWIPQVTISNKKVDVFLRCPIAPRLPIANPARIIPPALPFAGAAAAAAHIPPVLPDLFDNGLLVTGVIPAIDTCIRDRWAPIEIHVAGYHGFHEVSRIIIFDPETNIIEENTRWIVRQNGTYRRLESNMLTLFHLGTPFKTDPIILGTDPGRLDLKLFIGALNSSSGNSYDISAILDQLLQRMRAGTKRRFSIDPDSDQYYSKVFQDELIQKTKLDFPVQILLNDHGELFLLLYRRIELDGAYKFADNNLMMKMRVQ